MMRSCTEWADEPCSSSPPSPSMDIFKGFVARPKGIEEPTAQWGPRTKLWRASVSGSSTSSHESDSPPMTEEPPCPMLEVLRTNILPLQETPRSVDSPPLCSTPPAAVPFKKIRNVRKSDRHYCAVCGDRPTGYHYDVLSCNGCKTFFRRTIINKRRFKCTKGGTCTFNRDFRCACRACRFAKCVMVGMNKNAIQFPAKMAQNGIQKDTEDEAMDKSDEDEEVVRCDASSAVGSPESAPAESSIRSIALLNDEEYKYIHILDTLFNRERSTRELRRHDYPIFPEETLRAILKAPCLVGRRYFDSIGCQERQEKLYREQPVRFWMVADLFLGVEYAKTFEMFKKLSQSDQQCLLSHVGGIVQVVSQAYYSAELMKESITFPDGTDALSTQLKNKPKAYEHYFREAYCKPVEVIRELRLTERQFVLFKAVVLFSPNEMTLSEEGRQMVADARNRLASYLRKEMVQEDGVTRGTVRFGSAILALSAFLAIAEKRRNYLEVCDVLATVQLTSLAKGVFLKKFDL